MEKSLDYKGRWRNHTVAFRVSDEEAKLLNDLVALSGLTKQDYITRRLLCRDVVVQGNPRVYKALKNQMAAIHEELKRMESISPDNDELLYTLQVIAITLDGLNRENPLLLQGQSHFLRKTRRIENDRKKKNDCSRIICWRRWETADYEKSH